jgi:hypothetical protein
MTVLVHAGHRFGDLRQAAEVPDIQASAFFQNHDALKPALPFARQQRAGRFNAGLGVPRRSKRAAFWPMRPSSASLAVSGPTHRYRRKRRPAGGDPVILEAVTAAGGRRFAVEMIAPLSAKALKLKTFGARKNCRQESVGGEQSVRRYP